MTRFRRAKHFYDRVLAPYVGRNRRFICFLVVGFVNTMFGYSVFVVVLSTTGGQNTAAITATILGIGFNFLTTGRIVFGNRSWRALPSFVLVYAVALTLNLVVLNGLTHIGVDPLIAQAIALPMMVVSSYVLNARFSFRQTGSSTEKRVL